MVDDTCETGEVVCKLGGLVSETGKIGDTGEVMDETGEEVHMFR